VAKSKKRRPGGGRPRGARPAAKKQAAKKQATWTRAAKKHPAGAKRAKTPADKARRGGSQSTRAQRIEAARQARRRKSLVYRLVLAGAAALLVVLVATRVLSGRSQGNDTRQKLTAGSCKVDTNADPTDPSPDNHVSDPTYRVDPPAGGNHLAQATRPAVYQEGQELPDGQIVHAMEHGYVVLWEGPGLADADRQALLDVAGRYERDVLVVPRPTSPVKVAATAWGNRLLCGNVEPDALDLFTRTYRNQGPEKVPH